jgi:hypothetical protein
LCRVLQLASVAFLLDGCKGLCVGCRCVFERKAPRRRCGGPGHGTGGLSSYAGSSYARRAARGRCSSWGGASQRSAVGGAFLRPSAGPGCGWPVGHGRDVSEREAGGGVCCWLLRSAGRAVGLLELRVGAGGAVLRVWGGPVRARRGSAATTRNRPCVCPECGCRVRLARCWLVSGPPSCPVFGCGAVMSCPDLEDAALFDAGALEALAHVGPDPWRSYREGRKAYRPRCLHAGCSRFRKVGELHCSVHASGEMPF